MDLALPPAMLAAFPFARSLTAAGQRTLAEGAAAQRWTAGAMVLAEGDACPALLLVERGHLRVFKTSEAGKEITLYRVRPGDSCVVSMSAVLAGTPYPAHVSAPVDTVATAIPAAVFRRLFETEPAVQGLVIHQLSTLLTELMTLIGEVAFRRMDQRLAAFLLEETRQGRPVELSHEELATHLGTARTVVSRLLENFKDDGLVTIARRQIQVEDRPGLEGLLR
jgi:CRP/FNR family transcriptional regulator